ncbi:MAG TPA: cupin domain-containing protein, partial [Verrucomicrobiae bacterium]
MPIYHRLGEVPKKRHSVYRKPDGALYYEELMGNEGFIGPASLLYHLRRPTQVRGVRHVRELEWEQEPGRAFGHRHFRLHRLPAASSGIMERTPVLFNSDVAMDFVQAEKADDFFYRNAQGDELVFISEGAGVLESSMGELDYRAGDYLVIPRGVMHRYRFASRPQRWLVIESRGYIRTPER